MPYSFINVATSGQNLALPNSPTTYSTIAGTYQVMGFDDGYRNSDVAGTLYSGDGLASAVGYETSGTCNGLQAPGSEGTYYAQVIYAAQAALASQQTNYPGSKNIMIILSDGDATACNTQAYTTDGGNACSSGTYSQIVAVNCPSVTASGVCTSTKVNISTGSASSSCTVACPSGGCTGTPLNGTGTSTTNHNGYNFGHISICAGRVRAGCAGGAGRNSGRHHRLHDRHGFGDFGRVPDGPACHHH